MLTVFGAENVRSNAATFGSVAAERSRAAGSRGSWPAISAPNCPAPTRPWEAEGPRARARPFTGGLPAAGVVVVLALGYLLLVVAVLTQRDLANREHKKPK